MVCILSSKKHHIILHESGLETVGRCVNRTLHDLEPERSRRLDGLVNIGIDETSYKKGHKYITVIVNHDTYAVVWASEGHGKSVLEKFYKQLTPEQLSSIRVVTGDGANPDAMEALDAWFKWARHCRIPAFVELQKKINRHKQSILNTIEYGLTNARIEAINNKIKLSIRMAYGFRNIDNMMAMIMLRCSDIKV